MLLAKITDYFENDMLLIKHMSKVPQNIISYIRSLAVKDFLYFIFTANVNLFKRLTVSLITNNRSNEQ